MSKRTNIAALFMVFALLLCEFGLAVTDNSYRIASDGFGVSSGSGEAREASLSEDVDVTFVDYDTPELISARHSGSLFSVRSQSKGREFQRGGLPVQFRRQWRSVFHKQYFRGWCRRTKIHPAAQFQSGHAKKTF